MGKVEKIEQQIRELSAKELSELRTWFADFDAEAWDRQIKADAQAGKLDGLAQQALEQYKAGKTKPI